MSSKKEIILIGGGGHCKACIDVIEQTNKYNIVGIIDVQEKVGQTILGNKIIGTDDDIPQLVSKINYFFITVGQVKNPNIRIKLFNGIKKIGGIIPTIVSPTAYVSPHSTIGEGTIIMHNCVINADVKIGTNCIINNQALIEHETVIGNQVHISTGVRVNGNCKIGNNCFIGSGSIVNEGVEITKGTVIGSGSLIRKNIYTKGIFVGNPIKRISNG